MPRLITLFLYMVAELSALQQIINALTGLNGLWAVITECIVTTIYTCMFILRLLGPQTLNVRSSRRLSYLIRHRQYPRCNGRGISYTGSDHGGCGDEC